ncbi:MAG: DUF2920 family protein [Pseudomonadota bacterium]
MSLCFERRTIQGALDFELQRFRDSPLEFEVCYQPATPHPGVVFYIGGCGDPPGYSEKLLRHLTRDFGYAAVAVKYHCYHTRPETGATLALTDETLDRIRRDYFPELDSARLSLRQLVERLDEVLDETIELHAALVPSKEEYQNFGLMQALDHVYVTEYLERQGLNADFSNIMLIGSSHGGYIAHLLNKISPGFARVLIDNCSYTSPPLEYLWNVLEEGALEGCEARLETRRTVIKCYSLTPWKRCVPPEDPFYYGPAAQAIRDLSHAGHLSTMARQRDVPYQVFSWNAREGDTLSPAGDKIRQAETLRALGVDVHLTLVGEDDLDGRVLKTLAHGFDASLRGLFQRAHEQMAPPPPARRRLRPDRVSFECVDTRYTFQRTGNDDFPVMLNLEKF